MPTETLTADEVAAATGKTRAASQAAELVKRGVAFIFTGERVRVNREVANAYELLPSRIGSGIDMSKAR